MFAQNFRVWRSLARRLITVMCLALLGSIPALGGSTVFGSVAGSLNSTVGGQPVLPNSVIFSGDRLRVKEGATVIAMGGGSQLVFGRETEAELLRNGSSVSVLLGSGNVAVFSTGVATELEVRANSLSILPAKGFKTLGEVAMLDGVVKVTVKEGMLRVEGGGSPVEVAKGKTITIRPKTLRAPQANVGGGNRSQNRLTVAALGVGATGLIIGTVGISRANSANDAAAAATSTAASAASAAAAAAQAAQAATNLATAVASASLLESNVVGCDLNKFANSQGQPSPYTPPPGLSCR